MNTPSTPQSTWQRTTTRRVLCWLFNWRMVRRCLLTVAALVTIMALFYAEEDWRGGRAWDKHRRALEAKGEKFDIASLAPPPVPDEQNLAMTPLLKAICPFTHDPAAVRDTNTLKRLESIDWSRRDPRKDDELVVGSLEQGTLTDLAACAKFYLGNTNYPQPPAGAGAAQAVQIALGKSDPEFAELRAAAAARPLCRFPLHYSEEMPFAMLLPHLARVKSLTAVAELRAIARLDLGQPEETLTELNFAFRLTDSIREEPLLISHLVRITMLALDLQVVREGLARHAWSEAQLAAIEKQLAAIDFLAEYKRAMRGERALDVSTVEWACRQGWRFDPNQLFDSTGRAAMPDAIQLLRLMPAGWYRQNMLVISQFHQDYSLAVVNEHTRRVSPEIGAAANRAILDLRPGPFTIFARFLAPSVTKVAVKSARMQTAVDAARVGCAIEHYRLANGQWPESLDALVPKFMEKLPVDVITGGALKYRKEPAGGYVLYSVGWNQKDDGGTTAWSVENKRTVDESQGDWVWSLPK